MSTFEMPTKVVSQANEFSKVADAAKRLAELPPVMDDYYPECRHHYEAAIRRLVDALIGNGRISRQSFYGDVLEFHSKFDLPHPDVIRVRNLTPDEFNFRIQFMIEELREYSQAWVEGDIVKAADALVDLVYVALGTAAFQGLPFDQVWEVVHRANMSKIRTPSKEASKRGSAYDVIKPEGWVSPEAEIKQIIDMIT